MNKLDYFEQYMSYYIDYIVNLTYKPFYRVIYHGPVRLGHDIEWINNFDSKGWGKPDKDFGSIRIYYCCKNLKPLTFEKWIQNKK